MEKHLDVLRLTEEKARRSHCYVMFMDKSEKVLLYVEDPQLNVASYYVLSHEVERIDAALHSPLFVFSLFNLMIFSRAQFPPLSSFLSSELSGRKCRRASSIDLSTSSVQQRHSVLHPLGRIRSERRQGNQVFH